MNGDLIDERCRKSGFDPHELARDLHVDPFFLVGGTGVRALDGLPLGVARVLSARLGFSVDDLVESPRPPAETDDDVRLEAALGTAGEMCRDDIAYVFGWPLERVDRALAALAARLRRSGRTLTNERWHTYRVRANTSLLAADEQQRLSKAGPCGKRLDFAMADVLKAVIDGWTDRTAYAEAPAALRRLRDAGIVTFDGGQVALVEDVRFSLRLGKED